GVVIAALLFMRRMAESVSVQEQVFGTTAPNEAAEAGERVTLPENVLVYRIEGPFFFGAAEKLESTLERVQHHIRTVVIRLGRVPFMDATGMQTLAEIIERYQRRHVRVILCGMGPNLYQALRDVGTIALVGEANVCRDMTDVARRVAAQDSGPTAS